MQDPKHSSDVSTTRTSETRRFETNNQEPAFMNMEGARKPNNVFDIAKKILEREKKNATTALEEYWAFKNNVNTSRNGPGTKTIEELIHHYQSKLNTLRDKEESLVKIAQDSIRILAEKKVKDEELLQVKNELQDSEGELSVLKKKIDKFRSRSAELEKIKRENEERLTQNESIIINGVFEVSMAKKNDLALPVTVETPKVPVQAQMPVILAPAPQTAITVIPPKKDEPAFSKAEKPEAFVFPKSIVKTNSGKVIGQYFYNSKTDKDKRNYVFDGKYFVEQLDLGIQMQQKQPNDLVHTQLLQMASDCLHRISQKNNIHFEISTNELLNGKTLPRLIVDLRIKDYESLHKFIERYKAKTEALGSNYESMLKEQLERNT
jgi:hypothetical protein